MDTKKETTAEDIASDPKLVIKEIDFLIQEADSIKNIVHNHVDLSETFNIVSEALSGAREKCDKLLKKNNSTVIKFINTVCNNMLRQIIDQCGYAKNAVAELTELSEASKKIIDQNLDLLAASVESFLNKVSILKSNTKREKPVKKIVLAVRSETSSQVGSGILIKPKQSSYIGIIEATTIKGDGDTFDDTSEIRVEPGGTSVINEIVEKVVIIKGDVEEESGEKLEF